MYVGMKKKGEDIEFERKMSDCLEVVESLSQKEKNKILSVLQKDEKLRQGQEKKIRYVLLQTCSHARNPGLSFTLLFMYYRMNGNWVNEDDMRHAIEFFLVLCILFEL